MMGEMPSHILGALCWNLNLYIMRSSVPNKNKDGLEGKKNAPKVAEWDHEPTRWPVNLGRHRSWHYAMAFSPPDADWHNVLADTSIKFRYHDRKKVHQNVSYRK